MQRVRDWFKKWFSISWKKFFLIAALLPAMWFVYGIEFERVDAFLKDAFQYLNSTSKVDNTIVTVDINSVEEVFPRPLTFESIKLVVDKILSNKPRILIFALSPQELYFDDGGKNKVKKQVFDYLATKKNVFVYAMSSNNEHDMGDDPIFSKFPRLLWYYMITDRRFGPRDFKRRKAMIWYDKEGLPFEFTELRKAGFKIKDPEFYKYAWHFWGSKQAYIKTFPVGTFGSHDANWVLKQKNEDLNFEGKNIILSSNDEYSFLSEQSILDLSGKIGAPGYKAYSGSDSLANYINLHTTGDYVKLLQNFNDLIVVFFLMCLLILLNIEIKTKIYLFVSFIPLIVSALAILYALTSFYIDFSRSITLLFFIQYIAIPFVMLNIFKEQESKKLQEINDVRIDALLTVSEKVAHDIRSPLSAINIVMEKAKFDDQEYQDIFRAAVKRIDETATKILTRYRTKTGAENDTVEKFDLLNTIHSIVKEKRVLNSKILFDIDVQSEVTFALASKLDIERIISNIIDNSIYALRNHENPKIHLLLKNESEMLELTISDNGSGIPEHVLKLLGRERITTKGENNQGNGIGLLHAKRIIEKLNGRFEINSKEDHGTIIKITLPEA